MNSTPPKITVIIPTYNRTEFLAECLDSILAQTLPASQIIVVNDGAIEKTRRILGPYMKSINYLESDHLYSRSNAINYGLKEVTGDYVWIFDDDDVALPDALERFVAPLEKNPEHGFSYSTYFFTGNQQENNRLGDILWETPIPEIEERGILIPLLENNFLCGAALFARTSVYSRVGDFSSEHLRSQDYEMAIRIVRQFTGIRVAGGATFHYRQHNCKRGTINELFTAKESSKYWKKYNLITFQKVYAELPLAEYLPPGMNLEENRRRALLQRMSVMGAKLLPELMAKDLHGLVLLEDDTPFSPEEKRLIRNMLTPSLPNVGSMLNKPEFFNELNKLAGSSPLISMLRKEIMITANQLLRVGQKL
jgi:glycosyltransferase involved in cell wall biosynthesis